MIILYYANAFDAKTYPFLSFALFQDNGERYPLDAVFGSTFAVHEDALAQYGPPRLTATAVWAFFCQVLAIGAMFTHVIFFMGKEYVFPWLTCALVAQIHDLTLTRCVPYISNSLLRFWREEVRNSHHDPHFQAMKKYPEVPHWWYLGLFAAAIVAAFLTIGLSYTTLPWWGFAVSLVLGIFITPFSATIYSQVSCVDVVWIALGPISLLSDFKASPIQFGSSIATNMFSKMVAGAIHPGRPVANLFFSHFCHQVVLITTALGDMQKLGIYLKVPHRTTMWTQCYATVFGAFLGWAILSKIIENKRDILIDPTGNNQWSGQYYMSLNSQAVEWSLANKVFALGGGYEIVPLGILIGALIPVIHWLLFRRFATIRKAGEMVTTPLFLLYLQELASGINSTVTSAVVLGTFIQLWLRKHRPRIFREYAYLLTGAVDGAAQIVVVILSFTLLGGNGKPIPFPTWFGNPDGSPDHCVSTSTAG